MPHSNDVILVTGATGAQGGATARALLAKRRHVRILTRRPGSAAARTLRAAGAEVMRGDLDDAASLKAALKGVSGVFSVQVPDVAGNDSERRHGFALVKAAREAGVATFVHTSVTGTASHTTFPRWDSGYWSRRYWTDKWDIEEAARGAGFASWTVLRPAFMMDNFALPKARHMFPHLRQGEIATALHAGTRLQLIAANDIGACAAAAFERPGDFHGRNIDLAAQALTMGEVAAVLAAALGKPVVALELSTDEALARGLFPGWVRSQEWCNEVGYQADIAALAAEGIALRSFEQWVGEHRSDIVVEASGTLR